MPKPLFGNILSLLIVQCEGAASPQMGHIAGIIDLNRFGTAAEPTTSAAAAIVCIHIRSKRIAWFQTFLRRAFRRSLITVIQAIRTLTTIAAGVYFGFCTGDRFSKTAQKWHFYASL